MRRESIITLMIFLIILPIPPLMFIGSTLVIGAIEQSTEINTEDIEDFDDLISAKPTIRQAIWLQVIPRFLDVFSRIFTNESIIEKLYRIRKTSFDWIILEMIGIIAVGIFYFIYTRYYRGYCMS